MKTMFVIEHLNPPRLSIADLIHIPSSTRTMLISRINVPSPLRRKGFGSRLLKEIINAADLEGVRLILECIPSSDHMDFAALQKWYQRHGFQQKAGYEPHVMERLPLQSQLNVLSHMEGTTTIKSL